MVVVIVAAATAAVLLSLPHRLPFLTLVFKFARAVRQNAHTLLPYRRRAFAIRELWSYAALKHSSEDWAQGDIEMIDTVIPGSSADPAEPAASTTLAVSLAVLVPQYGAGT
ncbi:MAG: hypothetical protein ACM31O_14225 [Bacteroidota bacterium]